MAAAALPEPVRAMIIDAAITTGDETKVRTVIELARATNPDGIAELDTITANFEADLAVAKAAAEATRHDEIRRAGLFETWSGNASNIGLTVGAGLTRDGIVWRHRLNARADYQESEGVVTREQYFFAYEPNYKLSERLYAYSLAQYEQDRFQGFSSRYSASGGIGYDVLADAPVTLSIKAGSAWRRTDLVDGTSSKAFAGLAAVDFDWQLAETISLSQDASALLRSGRSTLISDTGLVAKVSNDVSIRPSYTVEHDTACPPAPSRPTH